MKKSLSYTIHCIHNVVIYKHELTGKYGASLTDQQRPLWVKTPICVLVIREERALRWLHMSGFSSCPWVFSTHRQEMQISLKI